MKKILLSVVLFSIILISFAVAFEGGVTIDPPNGCTKNYVAYDLTGNAFADASGSYSTSTHCSGTVCTWISGNQTIIGAYQSDPNTWGGILRYDFNISTPLNQIVCVKVMVVWPQYYGKGLHSPDNSRSGYISVKTENNIMATLPTNITQCGDDWFAHNCSTHWIIYDIPSELIEQTTKVFIKADTRTAWDVSQVTLIVYTQDGNIEIIDGKIHVEGQEFLVKGIDYAPWILTTGPEPAHEPFPDPDEDVTDKMIDSQGIVYVPDYNQDGRMQMKEVIQFDLETMKNLGINTIRTYASGVWHDRNLNEILDPGEINQGDLPDWVHDMIIDYAENNNMKVIIGYWLQEEDFKSGYICNWDDLEVAKSTMAKVVARYGSSPALLAWGIGNEVHGSWNQEWFTWGVPINDYINALNNYVRSIDPNSHPIIYSKYVTEDANLNNLNAEIIGINAYNNSAQQIIDAGELTIPATAGRAYMLTEFGHDLNDADDHWELAQQLAGGIFLEYNDVWWKTGQDYLGVMREYRSKRTDRYNKLYSLYVGLPVCNQDTTFDNCKTEINNQKYFCRDFGSGYKWYSESELAGQCTPGKRGYCANAEYICTDNSNWRACAPKTNCLSIIKANNVIYWCRNINREGFKWRSCTSCNGFGCKGMTGVPNYWTGSFGFCDTHGYLCTPKGWIQRY